MSLNLVVRQRTSHWLRLSHEKCKMNSSSPIGRLVAPKRISVALSNPYRCQNMMSYSKTEFGKRKKVSRAYFTTTRVSATQAFTENPFEHDVSGYQKVVGQTMKELVEKCEELESLNLPGFEVNEKDGVFELILGNKGTYVINKQAPNRQIWWSSPVSGPKRYNYDAQQKSWRNSRDGHYLYDLLNEELTSLLGIKFDMYTIAAKPEK